MIESIDMLESPPAPLYPPHPQPGDLIGHVGVEKRKCSTDGSFTVGLRWRQWSRDNTGPQTFRLRVGRTGPAPTRRELRNAVAQARVKAQETEKYLRDGLPPTQGIKRYGLRDAMANYLDALQTKASDSTYARRESRLLHFVNYHLQAIPDVLSVNGVTPQHVRDYLDSLRNGNGRKRVRTDSTLRLALCDLSGLFEFAETRDWCRGNPARAVREGMGKAHTRKPSPIILPDSLVRTLARGSAEVTFLFCTGLRVGPQEASGLTWANFDADNALLVVPESENERNKIHGRTIPVGPNLMRLLLALRHDERGLISPGLKRTATRLMGKHEFPAGSKVTPHRARKWFSTAMKKAGCPPPDVLYLIGHVQPANMGPYYGFSPDDIRPYVEKVDRVVFGGS